MVSAVVRLDSQLWLIGHLGEWKSMLMNPCIASVLATIATLFLGPLGDNVGSWGKRLTSIYRMGHLIHLLIKCSSAEVTFGEHSYET